MRVNSVFSIINILTLSPTFGFGKNVFFFLLITFSLITAA